MACAMASRCRMPWLYLRVLRCTESPSPAISSACSKCASASGRPVARQYAFRFSKPERCGRKPGPSTSAPIRDSTGEPGTSRCPKT